MAIEAASLRVHNEERGTDAVREDLAADFAPYWSEHANESLRARDFLLRCRAPGSPTCTSSSSPWRSA